MRRPLIAANWKMHLVRAEAQKLCGELLAGLKAQPVPGSQIVLFPAAPLLDSVALALQGSSIEWGGQDVHHEKEGAFTGDVSAAQLRDAGCSFTLCGHSERRRDHGETSLQVGAKMKAAELAGLRPILCLGESEAQRQAEQTEKVLGEQLDGALAGGATDFDIAYEPVWAIGSGLTATPQQAQEVHAYLRSELAARRGAEAAARARILYGGSVKAANAGVLFAEKDVDGFLVGGASLDSTQFLAIIAASAG